MVPGLVRRRVLREEPGGQSDRTRGRSAARVARCVLGEPSRVGAERVSSGDRSAVAQPIAGLPLRPGGSGRPVRLMIVALLVTGMTMPLRGETPPPPLGPATASSRTEIRVETSARDEALPADGCEVTQETTHRSSVTSWSTVGEVRPRDGEGLELVRAASDC